MSLPVTKPQGVASSALVTTVILTFNEELHIARSIASVQRFGSEVVIVDSGSTDRTVEIAEAAGARVLKNPFINYAKQYNWGLENGQVSTPWVLRLDADEIIGDDLGDRIARELPVMAADVAGITFDRRHIFMGRWVRHGGRYPLRLLRLWRTGQGEIEDRWMDEHVVIKGGRTIHMAGEFDDASLKDLSFFTIKHNGYAAREAIDILDQRYGLFEGDVHTPASNLSFQAAFKRAMKQKVYNRLPFGWGPLGFFLYRYILQLGFLDGKTGLIYHFLQGFWYRFLVEAKVLEMERLIVDCSTNDERLSILRQATGLKL